MLPYVSIAPLTSSIFKMVDFDLRSGRCGGGGSGCGCRSGGRGWWLAGEGTVRFAEVSLPVASANVGVEPQARWALHLNCATIVAHAVLRAVTCDITSL